LTVFTLDSPIITTTAARAAVRVERRRGSQVVFSDDGPRRHGLLSDGREKNVAVPPLTW
jgi:hypothetical protein